MEGLVLRRYQPEDADAVARITKAAWIGVTMAELRERRFGLVGGVSWEEQKTDAVLARCERHPERTLIAELDGVVVGYATYGFSVDGHVGIVGDNAVEPRWQGRGIGTRLIGRVIEELEASGASVLEVSTFEHDAPARRVYERFCFTEIARTVHYTRPVEGEKRGELGR